MQALLPTGGIVFADVDKLSAPLGFRSTFENTEEGYQDSSSCFEYSMGEYTEIGDGQILIALNSYKTGNIPSSGFSEYVAHQTDLLLSSCKQVQPSDIQTVIKSSEANNDVIAVEEVLEVI